MNRLRDIRERQTAIRSALLDLEKKGDDADDEDVENQDSLTSEFLTLDEEAKPLQDAFEKDTARRAANMEKVIAAAKDIESRESVSGPGLTVIPRTKRDPFEGIGDVRSGMARRQDLVARAKDAIELHAQRSEVGFGGDSHQIHDKAEQTMLRLQENTATRVSSNPDEWNLAQHILVTGTPEYREEFDNYLTNPLGVQRTALSLTLANGGYLLPYVLDPTIILTNTSSANPYRRIAAAKSTTSNAWQGVNSAGVTAAWLAEGAASSDATPTVGQIQITPKKAAAWVFGSYEVLADTDFAQQLPMLLSDARDRLEEAAFTTGNGTTAPKGVITASTNLPQTATTLVYAIADVYATQAALAPRFRTSSSAAWVMNIAYINKTRQFDTAGGASFWTNLGKGQPETLLGAPIYESTTMFGGTQAIGSKIAVFGDWSQMYIVDRVGVSLIYEPLVKDQATAFPTGQGGWLMFWRVGSDISTVNAFQVLQGK